MRQAEVVDNKRLSAALEFIEAQQYERTQAKIAKLPTTRRGARLLRAGTPRRRASGSAIDGKGKSGHLYFAPTAENAA